MKFRAYFFAAALLLGGAATAEAGPLLGAIPAVFGLTGFAATLVQLGFVVALQYGLALWQKSRVEEQPASGVTVSIQTGDDNPVSALIGTYATAGIRNYAGSWGAVGKTPNAYFVDVIELGNMPCSGLDGVWVNGERVTLLTEEPHATFGFPVARYRKNDVDYLWIKFYDGTQTEADSYLTEKFSDDPDRPFTADMIGLGCPYAIVTSRYNQDVHGQVPQCLFELGPLRLYDIRKDSTNGGSGAHRWNNPATWEPSSNPTVMAYNIIRGIYYGGEWFYGGQNLPAFRLPSSSAIAAAVACDVDISLSVGGVQPAYRAGYQIRGDEAPLEALRKIAQASNMRIAEVGGIFKFLVGSPGSAVYSFTDHDIIVTEGQSFEPFPTLDETVNGIEATYPSPGQAWDNRAAPARYDAALEAEDGDRRLLASVTLEACPFPHQVQRIMRAMLKDARKFRVHQFYLPPDAYPLEPNDVVSWSSARNGYTSKKFIVEQISSHPTMAQLVTLREMDPSDYDWSSSFELPDATGWTGPIYPPTQLVDGWEVLPATIYDADDVARRPSILVKAADELDDVRNVRVQVRLAGTTTVVFDSDAITYGEPYQWILNGTFLPNANYEVRGKLVPFSRRQTDWSAWLPVTTPNVLLGGGDVYVDIDLSGLDEIIGWTTEATRQLIEEVRSLIDATDEHAWAAYSDRQSLRRELVSTTGDITSSYLEAIEVATGPTSVIGLKLEELEAKFGDYATAASVSALSVRVDETEDGISAVASRADLLYASMGGSTASINVAWKASATPSGYAARYGVTAAVNGDGYDRVAAFYLDVPSATGGQTRVVMQADQVIMTDGTNLRRPFVYTGGVLYLDDVRANSLSAISANAGTLTAGIIRSDDSKVVINLNTARIVISS